MDLYFLGAGKPASGNKPSALKNIVNNSKAMDWQLDSFSGNVDSKNIYFLGGYHVGDVVEAYPNLKFSVLPNWENSSVLDTLFHAPFAENPVVVSYTDTLFRKAFISDFLIHAADTDVAVVIDRKWKKRYESRNKEDIHKAETLLLNGKEVEFTGLLYLGSNAVSKIKKTIISSGIKEIGTDLLDLITFLKRSELDVTFQDIGGDWTEFNSPADIANFILGTKADTLARLEPIVKASQIGKQESFTIEEWLEDQESVLRQIRKQFGDTKLVVRSSSKSEDNWRSSNAGCFESILNVSSTLSDELPKAIQSVVDSYGHPIVNSDQVLVQEFLQDVAMAGVVFTCTLESGAPYYRFNFDDTTKSTESVTAGTHSDLRTVLVSKLETELVNHIAPELAGVLSAVKELEVLLGFDKLDIEFAVDTKRQVHIFQVRPVVVNHGSYEIDIEAVSASLKSNVLLYQSQQHSSPQIVGDRTLFANMPDWNPAEIISTRPKPLAFSLYRQLITNDIWAEQRAQFGYRDVRPHPLIISFSGQPYVDVRASFNSFIPKSVSNESAHRIVNAYIALLSANPHYHDKIEFEVAFTIWTPLFAKEARDRLTPYGVTSDDLAQLEHGLKSITQNALLRLDTDILSADELVKRSDKLSSSHLSTIDKIYALLDDCRRFGTLAFSHAARAGFIATTFLNYLVKSCGLSQERKMLFLNSFDTVTGLFEKDKFNYLQGSLSLSDLLRKYGHLRPGTYDVTAAAYWEVPDQYLIPKEEKLHNTAIDEFVFSQEELNAIDDLIKLLGSTLSVSEFTRYLVRAIQERERVKFEFTRNLSQALDQCVELGHSLNLSREDVAFLNYSDLTQLKLNTINKEAINSDIQRRKEVYELTKIIELPSLIDDPAKFYSFERHSSQPNFIGVDKVIANISSIQANIQVSKQELTGKIVMIPQADPGYDWLFEYKISGLVTLYGGCNSHMAIRSAEMGIPAAIGIGEKLYESLLLATHSGLQVELDCLGQILRVVE
jgi:phosphohistidine swiveling domain-containing protein